MKNIAILCRTATPFAADGSLDEEALRQHLSNIADSKIGFYLASGGIGEGYAMSLDEIKRVYQIAVSECGGKVPIYANFPEQHTGRDTLIHCRLAIEAGCELINIYPIAGWHGMRPNDDELRAYYELLFREIKHPIALAVNAVTGYLPKPQLIADTIHKYPQIEIVNLNGGGEDFLVALRGLVKREIQYNMPIEGILSCLGLGANGITGPQANFIPKTFRRFVDLYEQGEREELGKLLAGMLRFKRLTERWNPSNVRWAKMCMKVLKLPGHKGGVREPYVLPGEDQMKILADNLAACGLPELDDLARAAGLK